MENLKIYRVEDKYINFLKSGSRKGPIELLFDAGVDLEKQDVFNRAFETAHEMIETWKKLIK